MTSPPFLILLRKKKGHPTHYRSFSPPIYGRFVGKAPAPRIEARVTPLRGSELLVKMRVDTRFAG
jgi:hypothetical protein